jgi:hypothetical protein
MSANDHQVGGDHYIEFEVQVWDIIKMYDLGYLDGHAVKYLLRWKRKGGVVDLAKAAHFIEKLIEQERADPSIMQTSLHEVREGAQRPTRGED